MSSYGKKRENVQIRRVKGERSASQSAQLSRRKKRRRVSVDASARQEEVTQPLVLIEWLDSFGCSANWQNIQIESVAPLVCRSVGWLVYDGADCKVVVPHLTDPKHQFATQQGCGDMTIPVCAIVSVRRLGLGKPQSPS